MKHTKRLTSAILATVMVLSMMISAAILPATATDTDDLSKKLYLHYDFNSADPNLAVQDKAPTGGLSKVADNLVMSGSSLGSANAPGTSWAIAPNFEFNGYSVSPTDRRAALKANHSADMEAIQAAGSSSTWFVRFKMDGFESELATVEAATAVHFGSYSQNSVPDKDGTKMAKPFVVSVTKNNLQMQYTYQATTVKTFWESSEWLNASLVRTYNQDTNDYTYVYTVYNDALQVLKSETATGGLDTYQNEEVFLFRSPNEGGFSTTESWSGDTGLSLDDVRCYGVALTQEQIKNIVSTEFSHVSTTNDNLLMHYDFAGSNLGEMLTDKSYGKSAASTVEDTMTLSSTTGGFAIHEGKITSQDVNFFMYVNHSDDIDKSQNGAESTWFIRFKSIEAPTGGEKILIDFRDTNKTGVVARPIYIELKSVQDGWNHPKSFFNNNYDYVNNKENSPVVCDSTSSWTRNEWMNFAIVRTQADNGHYYINVYYISDSGKLTQVYKTLDIGTTYQQGTDVAFFCSMNDSTNAREWGTSTGLAYDDIRCYNTALAPHQLSQLVVENFGDHVGDNVINTGLQIGVGTNSDTKQVRLIAQIKGSDYTAAGFKVTATWDGQKNTPVEQDLACSFAYSSVIMEQTILYNGNRMTWNGNYYPDKDYYLIAVIVDNIPTDLTNLKLTFKPYATGDAEYTGESFTYNVTTGTYVQ